MTRQLVLDLSTEAFADAIDMLSIIETLEAGNTPAAVAAVRAAKTDAVAVCIYRSLWSHFWRSSLAPMRMLDQVTGTHSMLSTCSKIRLCVPRSRARKSNGAGGEHCTLDKMSWRSPPKRNAHL